MTLFPAPPTPARPSPARSLGARIVPAVLAASLAFSHTAQAFCGFYVATSDQPLVNRASRVVLAHDGDRTVVTMASDVSGDPKQFAIVVPVPTVIEREQVRLAKPEDVEHLAEFSKPRLVEYFDPDPCRPPVMYRHDRGVTTMAIPSPPAASPSAGVHVEAQYSVGEYDIVVLSATDSSGLLTYLEQNHYRLPRGAAPTVGSYIRQNMHFFLAKVNLDRLHAAGASFLRPLQVEYRSRKFMLPIRLGTVNADGPQDMIVLALTPHGRVETTNYRTARIPTGIDVPLFVGQQFGQFYDTVFAHQVDRNNGDAVFLEYAWNIGAMMCDPCSAPPLTGDELHDLGAAWLPAQQQPGYQTPGPLFVTRLHVRYDLAHFPEDLQLQETPDTDSFQVRFVMRHPFQGDLSCAAGAAYRTMLAERRAQERTAVAELTGWTAAQVASRMKGAGDAAP